MEIGLLIFYAVVLILLLLGLAICFRRNRKKYWAILFATELGAAIFAMRLARYFDALPLPNGSLFPGLEYFAEVFYSMGAAAIYACVLGTSLMIYIYKATIKGNKRQNSDLQTRKNFNESKKEKLEK